MRDLTTRQMIETILRSLNENWDRMAAKYKGVAPDQPAPGRRRGSWKVSGARKAKRQLRGLPTDPE